MHQQHSEKNLKIPRNDTPIDARSGGPEGQAVRRPSASKGGALFVFADGAPVRGKAVAWLQDLMSEFLEDESLRLSTAAARMGTIRPSNFVDVDRFMTADEVRDDPIRVRLRARGLGVNACAAIPMPSGEMASGGNLRSTARADRPFPDPVIRASWSAVPSYQCGKPPLAATKSSEQFLAPRRSTHETPSAHADRRS